MQRLAPCVILASRQWSRGPSMILRIFLTGHGASTAFAAKQRVDKVEGWDKGSPRARVRGFDWTTASSPTSRRMMTWQRRPVEESQAMRTRRSSRIRRSRWR